MEIPWNGRIELHTNDLRNIGSIFAGTINKFAADSFDDFFATLRETRHHLVPLLYAYLLERTTEFVQQQGT